VYITSFFPPDRVAGAELGMHFMAKYMAERGHDVHVVITRSAQNRAIERRDGYQIHWLQVSKVKGLKFFSEIKKSLSLLKQIKPDLIHANCLLPGGYIAAKYGSVHQCKTVVLCYGYDVSDMKFPMSLWGKWALEHVQRVLVATRYCKQVVQNWVPSLKPEVFLAGCDLTVFPKIPYRAAEDKFSLLFIGRLIPEKGLDFLIELMDQLPENYHLTVIGTGEALPAYKAKTAKWGERVNFVGQVQNSECSQWLAQSDALVLPSYREPFGVVCIEAVVSGVPVVCSDAMGLPEAVADGINGKVVKGRDAMEWIEAIRACCEGGEFRQKIYQASESYRDKWAWSTRLRDLENLYREP